MEVANRVILNTALLYIKLLFAMIIGLFTTRLVLAALGESDFGIYSLVAGVVGMLAFLQSAMTGASMRFMSYSIGLGYQDSLQKTFNTTLLLHLILSVILVVIIEIGGIIMFKYFLNIPVAKVMDAKIVFHFMALTTFITVISVPYDAVLNSHENIPVLTIVDLLGNVMRLGIAIFLTYCDSNLLIIYGLLMLITQIILRVIKQLYSRRKYPECKVNLSQFVDKSLIKSILSFSSWSLLGSISSMAVTQIKSVLLNIFFGVRLNAANGIAMTVSSQVNTVSTSMTQAIRPQLIQSEGKGDRHRMVKITTIATKFSIFLYALFAIPVIIELPYLLNLWLTTVPEYAVVFGRLIIFGLFMDKLSFEIGTAISAVGDIRNITITESCIILISVLVSYIFFKYGFPPYTIFIVGISFSIFIFILRLYFGKRIAGIRISDFFKNALMPVLIPIIITTSLALVPQFFIDESLFRLTITILVSMATIIITFRYIGLTNFELVKFKGLLNISIHKLKGFLSHHT